MYHFLDFSGSYKCPKDVNEKCPVIVDYHYNRYMNQCVLSHMDINRSLPKEKGLQLCQTDHPTLKMDMMVECKSFSLAKIHRYRDEIPMNAVQPI